MFGNFQRHDEIECSVQVERLRQIMLQKAIFRDQKHVFIDIVAINPDDVLNTVISESGEPGTDTASHIDHA